MKRRISTRQPGVLRVLAAALACLAVGAPLTARAAAGMPRAGALFLPSEGVAPELAADLTEVLSATLESGGAAEVIAREAFEIVLREVGRDPAACLRDAGCAREAGRRAELDFVVVAEAQRAAGGFRLQLTRYSVGLELLRTARFDLDEKLGQLTASLESARGDLLRPDGALLRVDTNVEDAAVMLDGVLLGVTPLAPREVLPGSHEVMVRRDGWLPASARVDCAAAAPCRVSLRLQPEPEPVAEPAEPPPQPREPPPLPPPPGRGMSAQRVLAWTSVGLAVAAGATGTGFAVRTGQIQDEIDAKCDGDTRTCTLSRSRAQSLQDDGELMATLTNVFYGVAGAAAVAAVVLFLTEPDDEPARVEVVPQASADGFGVGAFVRF